MIASEFITGQKPDTHAQVHPDETAELDVTPIDVVTTTEPDLYGQVHPIETEELILRKLAEFEEVVENLSSKDTQSLQEAEKKCPELLTDKFKLMFLRCELFNAHLAAQRYAKYWEKRLEICGPEKAYLPLTLDKALKDDWVPLSNGSFQYLPNVTDATGRAIVYGDASKADKKSYFEPMSATRMFWYMVHAALESEEAQKKGVVFTISARGGKWSELDRERGRLNLQTMEGAVPVRLSVVHLCHPPTWAGIVMKIAMYFIRERTRKRIRLHMGTDEEVLEALAQYGLDKDVLPTGLGGNLVLDTVGWLEKRRAEGK